MRSREHMKVTKHTTEAGCSAAAHTPRTRWNRWLAAACMLLLGLMSLNTARAVESVATSTTSNPPALSAVPASRAAQRIAVITIEGEINAVTAKSFQRRLDAAIRGGADCIVVDLNTPGGEVGAVLDICSMIKQSAVPNVIAWVNPTAYSGGAIIALACREIVLTTAATMGDAAPVAGDPINFARGLQRTERQKILAPLLAEIVDSARMRGYDEKLVQAFVTLDVELWRIRDKQSGNEYFVDEAEYRMIFGEEPRRGRPHIASGSIAIERSAPSDLGAQSDPEPGSANERSGEAVSEDPTAFRPASPTLAGDAIPGSAAITTASTRPTFTESDRGRYELIEYALDGQTLLTLKEADLRRYGFADKALTVNSDQDLKGITGAQYVVRLDQSWSEHVVSFMTQGMTGLIVRGILIAVFLIALFIEMSVPGVGLPGGIALLALAGLVVPPMLIGASTWWALALILGGILLVLLELFVMPGFGIPGILGLIMLFGGLIGTFAGVGQLFPGVGGDSGSSLTWAASVVLMAMFIAGVGIYFFVRYTDKFPLAGKLVLSDRAVMPGDEDEQTMLEAMSPSGPAKGPVAVGSVGRTITPLRPSGSAEFGDQLVDVVSDFGFVEAGTSVRVVSASEYRVVVELLREPPTMPGQESAAV